MSALWTKDSSGWRVLAAVGFPNETTLHDLIEEAPNLLPLSGAPRLTILGREVGLASGSADLIAVETSGQPVFIEIKLGKNPEARRAVVAQVLSYAASVRGLDLAAFEGQVLAPHLRQRGFNSILDAAASGDDSGAFEADSFTATLADCLATGAARLVLVLDAAPPELMRLGGYLEAVSERLTVDLITVSQYDVGGQTLIVPQRVDPGREEEVRITQTVRPTGSRAQYAEGGDAFFAGVTAAASGDDQHVQRLREWAERLERDSVARLATTTKSGSVIALRIRLLDEDGGPVTLWNGSKGVALSFWPSVLRRRAPLALAEVERLAPRPLKDGDNYVNPEQIAPELLDALARAYREAATSNRPTP